MTPSSAKNKGRLLCKLVKAKILESCKLLSDDDIKVTSSGANGEDLQLSPTARAIMPISIECKNRAAFAIYKDFKQATDNSKGHNPVLIIKQNNSQPLAVISLDYFLKIV